MDIRHFKTFKKILETGSYSKAADSLGYTQSSVTAHIKCLEADLGLKIFDRIGRKMVLTVAGQELAEHAEKLLLTLEKIDSIGDDLSQIRGTVRVSAPASIVLFRLCYILRRLMSKAPNVNIVLSNFHSSNMVRNMLTSGESDVAIVMEDTGGGDESFIVQKLEASPMCIIAGRGMDISTVNLTKKNEPLGCGIVVNQKDSHFRQEFEAYLKEQNITPSNIIEVWGIESIKRCVSYNLGISILPMAVIEDEIKKETFNRITTDKRFSDINICMVTLKNKWESPVVKMFKQTVVECFEAADWPGPETSAQTVFY